MKTETTIKKEVYELGEIDYTETGSKDCLCTIEYKLKESNNGFIFTASANVWDSNQSDIYMGGQCLEEVCAYFPTDAKAQKILTIWKAYHLNNMKAGTPRQEAEVKAWTAAGNKYEYDAACKHLDTIGLLYDEFTNIQELKCTGSFPGEVLDGTRGYKYGERWIFSPIPARVVSIIKAL